MVEKISASQAAFDMGFSNAEEFRRAAERGRRMAAEAVRLNPLKKAEMEARFGMERCRQRWPEAYRER